MPFSTAQHRTPYPALFPIACPGLLWQCEFAAFYLIYVFMLCFVVFVALVSSAFTWPRGGRKVRATLP